MGLAQKAELVHLTVFRYKGSVIDRDVDATINRTYKTQREAGQFRKWAINRDALKGTQRAQYELERFHKSLTVPWDNHYRLLPITLHFDYMEGMGKREGAYMDVAMDFCVAWQGLVHAAEGELGAMWKADDYPTISEIPNRFRVVIEVAPVPESGDFRLDLGEAEVARIRAEMENNTKLKLASAMSNAWQRLYSVIKDMVERMEKSKRPRDTIITNISELCGILPHLNLGDDNNLEKMRREVEKRLCVFDPKAIRESPDVRKQAKETAEDIMKKMEGYL